jgi:lysophospholipase L1-like esterase
MKKKILIIGDSNSLPRYDDNNFLRLEDIYVYKIKNFFRYKNFDIEQVSWGGITTSQLINFAINYFEKWKPDFVVVHSGINDIKTQLLNSNKVKKIFRIFEFFNINKHLFKNNILYNNKLLKHHSISKTSLNSFLEIIKKLKNRFSNSKIFWIEIHSDRRIDFSRFGTYEKVKNYNKIIEKEFLENFIKIDSKKKYLLSDGFHLNRKGHLMLFKKLCKYINSFKL